MTIPLQIRFFLENLYAYAGDQHYGPANAELKDIQFF